MTLRFFVAFLSMRGRYRLGERWRREGKRKSNMQNCLCGKVEQYRIISVPVKPVEPGRAFKGTQKDGKGRHLDTWVITCTVPSAGNFYCHLPIIQTLSTHCGRCQCLRLAATTEGARSTQPPQAKQKKSRGYINGKPTLKCSHVNL